MNALDIDLTGKMVVVKAGAYEGLDGDEASRRFLCESGPGCRPDTVETGILGKFLADGGRDRIEGADIEKVVDATDIATTNAMVPATTPVLIAGAIVVHPAAQLFPEMERADFEKLKESISQHGIRVPVVTQNCQIVDGRNRARAWLELGKPIRDLPVQPIPESVDPYAYAWDLNCSRLDYTPAQKVALRAKIDEASGLLARERAEAEQKANALRAEKQTGNRNAAKDKPKNSGGSREPPLSKKSGSPEARLLAERADVSVSTARRVLDLKAKDPAAFEHLAATGELPKKAKQVVVQPHSKVLETSTTEAPADRWMMVESRGTTRRVPRQVKPLAKFLVKQFTTDEVAQLVTALVELVHAAKGGTA